MISMRNNSFGPRPRMRANCACVRGTPPIARLSSMSRPFSNAGAWYSGASVDLGIDKSLIREYNLHQQIYPPSVRPIMMQQLVHVSGQRSDLYMQSTAKVNYNEVKVESPV